MQDMLVLQILDVEENIAPQLIVFRGKREHHCETCLVDR